MTVQPKFRAAFDFLLLRAAFEPGLQPQVDYWQAMIRQQSAAPAVVGEIDEGEEAEAGSDGIDEANEDAVATETGAPKKRRRRRRRKPKAGPSAG